MKYFACLILLVSFGAEAQNAADCSRIENARERLICYDQLFPADDRPLPKTATKRAPTQIEPQQLPGRVESTESVAVPVPSIQSPGTTRTPTPDRSTELSKGGMFDKNPEVNMTAIIKAVSRQDQKKMVFLLDNNEVWLQDSPRSLPIRKGDMVTIKNTRMGGYIMRTEGGTSTRVRRIK